jgi:hypothetical protein
LNISGILAVATTVSKSDVFHLAGPEAIQRHGDIKRLIAIWQRQPEARKPFLVRHGPVRQPVPALFLQYNLCAGYWRPRCVYGLNNKEWRRFRVNGLGLCGDPAQTDNAITSATVIALIATTLYKG